ncbi:glycerophosphodiester phosphodiesterase family protein [Leifsonia sp. AK011]|uniref:glycerophosphodiester phosphodiesterase n=1 Tax=Leifsonia sp. AK011 TaxID=2723075 RepID=UPI00211C3393|nr:glycerophosphodiester phosphodiesterase family protein [Leifsonia sp. AK011]
MPTQLRRRPVPGQPLLAAAGALVLVMVMVLIPGGAPSASTFSTLRQPGEVPSVAGHRGDLRGGPENTLPALQAVLDSSAEFVETDVQLTADGVPVLMHDWTLDRTTDGTGPVWAATWDEISELDAGSWAGSEYAGLSVPHLPAFLGILKPSDKHAIIELKGSWTAEQVAIVTTLIQEWELSQRVVLASFDLMTLQAAQSVAPTIERVIISREVNGDPAVLAEACGAIGIVTSISFVQRFPEVVDRIHAAGLGVMLYTLNDEGSWSEAISLGVDGIITDTPADLGSWARDQ